jgi:hypothetical protein
MTTRSHVRLLVAATVVWLGFWVAGLPDYYQQYSTRSLVLFEVLLLPPVWAAGFMALRVRRRLSRMKRALAISFYFTIPLFLYDLIYCGLHLGHGLRFVVHYWYLTVYYFVPWALFPLTALWLEGWGRTDSRITEVEPSKGVQP